MARLAAMLAALACGGCGTVNNHAPMWHMNELEKCDRIYGGIRHDLEAIRDCARPVLRGQALGSPDRPVVGEVNEAILYLLDLPLSLVADTLWLPHDLRAWNRRRHAPPAESVPADEPTVGSATP